MKFEELSSRIIGCAIEVHKVLGPGLLESAYQHCLAHELSLAGMNFAREQTLPVRYKGLLLDCGYRIDLMVENTIIIECKSVEALTGVHEAQLLTYMKLAEKRIGLLINFNVQLLKEGLRRFVK